MSQNESVFSDRAWRILLGGVCGLAVSIGLIARVWNLGYPPTIVFDEVHYVGMARKYLRGVPFFDVHPPLGKFPIAAGIALLGDDPAAWRVGPALVGIATVALLAATFWNAFKSRAGAALVAALASLDGFLIVYSRTALLDGILLFFVFLACSIALLPANKRKAVGLGVAAGLATAVKWPGLAILVPAGLARFREPRRTSLIVAGAVAAGVYVGVVVLGLGLTHTLHRPGDVLKWHVHALNFHEKLAYHHPFETPWWSWPFQRSPLVLFDDKDAQGYYHEISTRGNPLVWWSSSLATLFSLAVQARRWWRCGFRRTMEHRLSFLLLGYFAFLLPYAFIHRSLIVYLYLPSYGFALLILGYWLSRLWEVARWAALLFMAQAVLVTLLLLPSAVGWMRLGEAFRR